jgi:hypothetical protein
MSEMTKSQGDEIIGLLERILRKLDDVESSVCNVEGEVSSVVLAINALGRKMT